MAKKKSKSSDDKTENAASSSATTAAQENTDASGASGDHDDGEEVLELLQVDLGDMVKMKQVLDEGVAGAILEQVEEDFVWDNFKLGLMATACLFAMIAQFAPVPFPESRPILGVCGSVYFILSGILQFITSFIDQDAILLTKPLTTQDKKSKNADLSKYGIRVRSSIPRFSEWYTVILELRMEDPNKNKNIKQSTPFEPPQVQQVWSVGQFFDKEGFFDEVGLTQEIEKLFKRLESADYDTALDSGLPKKKQQ